MVRQFRKLRNFGRKRKWNKERVGRRLSKAGWAIFMLSMLLPAMTLNLFDKAIWFGWQCAWAVMTMLWPGNWATGNWWMGSFALTNLLMALTPLLLRNNKTHGKMRFLVPALLTIASLDIVSTFRMSGSWMVGYYVWFASYLMITTGSILTLQGRNSKRTPGVSAPMPKSAEERAAERELDTYLKFS